MLAHVSIQCADFAAQRPPSTTPSSPPRRRPHHGADDAIGYGIPPSAAFWIGRQQTGDGFRETHIAFQAPDQPPSGLLRCRPRPRSRTAERAAALARVRPAYYGAFVRDPDGNNIEATDPRAAAVRPGRRPTTTAVDSSERRHELVQHRRAQVLLRRRQGAGGLVGRRLGRLRLVQPDAVRRDSDHPRGTRPRPRRPDPGIRPAPMMFARRSPAAGLVAAQALPRSCCTAALAALNSGQTSAAPCTVLPPLSMATIACVGEDAGRCHVVPRRGH